jgi:hypothetical protein
MIMTKIKTKHHHLSNRGIEPLKTNRNMMKMRENRVIMKEVTQEVVVEEEVIVEEEAIEEWLEANIIKRIRL